MATEKRSAGKPISVPLDDLLLDPNNYRFVDQPEYRRVDDTHVADEVVQRRTYNLIIGDGRANIQDLIDSFRESGWLQVDLIQVRPLASGKYRVVEGNRRVSALKYLKQRYFEKGFDLGALDPTIFKEVPVITYEDTDEAHYLVLMGLKHVSGNKKWPPINQARMLRSLREDRGQSPEAICKAVGIGRGEFNIALRTLKLCEAYQASDYGDQFRSDQYSIFRAVVTAPKLRDWIGWDDAAGARNKANLERLFGWLSSDVGEDEDSPRRDPAVATSAQVRELVAIIDDPKALDRLDSTRSLSNAKEGSNSLLRKRVRESLDVCNQEINQLFQLAADLTEDDLTKVESLIAGLRGVSAKRGRFPAIFQTAVSETAPFNQLPKAPFSGVFIERYRGLTNVRLDSLARVNLLAGINNAGKTSALEAIHLLARQHDVTGVLDVVKSRSRIAGEPDPRWLVKQLPPSASVKGTFEGTSAEVDITYERLDDVEDQAFYLGSLVIESAYGPRAQRSVTTFRERRDRTTTVEGSNVLCRSLLSSPFSLGDPDLLAAVNRRSVEKKSKEKILDFLRAHVDEGLVTIEMVDEFKRFLVSHRAMAESLDLSNFGDGMQRVFVTSLLFAWVENGVLLLDEFENAIHASLLVPLARFVVELARAFNVQVFIASHSKEAIDAFVGQHMNGDLAGYALVRRDHKVEVERFDGARLDRLRELADFDLRIVR